MFAANSLSLVVVAATNLATAIAKRIQIWEKKLIAFMTRRGRQLGSLRKRRPKSPLLLSRLSSRLTKVAVIKQASQMHHLVTEVAIVALLPLPPLWEVSAASWLLCSAFTHVRNLGVCGFGRYSTDGKYDTSVQMQEVNATIANAITGTSSWEIPFHRIELGKRSVRVAQGKCTVVATGIKGRYQGVVCYSHEPRGYERV